MKRFLRPTYEQYKAYRIYQSLTTDEILNNLAVLKSCKYSCLVDNAPKLYDTTKGFVGSDLTNNLLLHTYGKKFVAGVNAEQLRDSINKVNAQGMGVVVYYLAEALDGKVFDEKDFDYFLTKYIESIGEARINPVNGAAVRATALGNLDAIKKMNVVQKKIGKLFSENVSELAPAGSEGRVKQDWADTDKVC